MKTKKTKNEDGCIEHRYFKFSETERTKFKALLRRYPKNFPKEYWQYSSDPLDPYFFDYFMVRVEADVQLLIWMKKNDYSKIDHRESTKTALKIFKKTAKIIDQIETNRFYIPMQKIAGSDVSPQGGGNHPFLDNAFHYLIAKKSMELAREVASPLHGLIKILESYQETEGKKAGSPERQTTKFIKQFANTFSTLLIGNPTAYREGLFFKLIVLIFEILELPATDPSRGIKKALQNK